MEVRICKGFHQDIQGHERDHLDVVVLVVDIYEFHHNLLFLHFYYFLKVSLGLGDDIPRQASRRRQSA